MDRNRQLLFAVLGIGGAAIVAACVGDPPAEDTADAGDASAGDGSSGADGSGGDGSPSDSGTDAGPFKPADPIAIAAGLNHACALRADHKVYCWGNDADGELGPLGDGGLSSAPVEVPFAAGVNPISIFAEENATCAIADNGSVWCWGSNANDGIGNGNTGSGVFASPQEVQTASGNLSSAISGAGGISLSQGAIVITTDAGVMGWGASVYSTYGFVTSSSPVAVVASVSSGNLPILSVATSGYHSAAIVTHGGNVVLATWGNNGKGELGTDAASGFPNPTYPVLPGAATPALVATGGQTTCAVDTNGALSCWGDDSVQQLGEGCTGASLELPCANVEYTSQIIGVAVGSTSTCVLQKGGNVYCFGGNESGELGALGVGAHTSAGQQIAGIAADAVAIVAGDKFYCAIRDGIGSGGRSVWCWGANYDQQLGAVDGGQLCGAACSPDPVRVALPAE